MNKIVEGSDYEQTYQQSINELGLDVVTEFEMQKPANPAGNGGAKTRFHHGARAA